MGLFVGVTPATKLRKRDGVLCNLSMLRGPVFQVESLGGVSYEGPFINVSSWRSIK